VRLSNEERNQVVFSQSSIPASTRARGTRGRGDRVWSDAALLTLERSVAKTYACLGEPERALEHLEKAIEANEPNLPEIIQSPDMAALRTNPRFAAVRKKIKPRGLTDDLQLVIPIRS
jgi:tetratricopeptide (TPR) repeat protein